MSEDMYKQVKQLSDINIRLKILKLCMEDYSNYKGSMFMCYEIISIINKVLNIRLYYSDMNIIHKYFPTFKDYFVNVDDIDITSDSPLCYYMFFTCGGTPFIIIDGRYIRVQCFKNINNYGIPYNHCVKELFNKKLMVFTDMYNKLKEQL